VITVAETRLVAMVYHFGDLRLGTPTYFAKIMNQSMTPKWGDSVGQRQFDRSENSAMLEEQGMVWNFPGRQGFCDRLGRR
jgi:hypothetical protein